MKKIFCILLLTLISLSLLFAYDGKNQKVWSVDDDVYRALKALYIQNGLSEPSSSLPYSGDELSSILEKIDYDSLNPSLKETYNYIKDKIEKTPRFNSKDDLSASLSATFSPEVYIHTNKEDYTSEEDWKYGYLDRSPFLDLGAEAFLTKYFYFDVELGVGPDYGKNSTPITDINNDVYSQTFSSSLPIMFSPFSLIVDFNVPNRAVIAAGGKHFSFQLGRDRLSWGNGESGNLMLGDNFQYHNFFKFDTHFDSFKFTFLVSIFPHPGDVGQTWQSTPINGLKAFIGHRFEFRFFHDKMSLSLNESIMFQSITNTFDIRILNPVYLYHDLYIRGNANSLMSLEFSYTIIPTLEAYLQLAVDDFPLMEPVEPESGATPNAFGYILGLKYSKNIFSGTLSSSLEFAYTDPFLYLREKYDGNGFYGVGYDGYLRLNRSGSIFYVDKPIGYKYGPDALVVDLKASFDSWSLFNINTEFMFMAHGVNDLNSTWSTYHGTETVPHTPSNANPFAKGDEAKKNKVEYTFMLSLGGSYNIFPRFKVYGDISMFLTLNKGNMEKAPSFDGQFTLGASYKFD